MAAEGVELKDEQLPPQEEGGDDEVRSIWSPPQEATKKLFHEDPTAPHVQPYGMANA